MSNSILGEALLACGLTNGSIRILRICQELDVSSQEILSCSAGLVVNVDTTLPTISNFPSLPTAMKWINLGRNKNEKVSPSMDLRSIMSDPDNMLMKPTLVCARPGELHFLQFHSVRDHCVPQVKTLVVPQSSTSPASCRFLPVTGVIRLDRDEGQTLRIVLLDGSVHVVRNACSDPEMDSEVNDRERNFDGAGSLELDNTITSQMLSHLVRSAMMEAEPESSRFNVTGRISTALSFGAPGTIIWIHE